MLYVLAKLRWLRSQVRHLLSCCFYAAWLLPVVLPMPHQSLHL